MSPRRAALIALRILALYFAITGLESFVTTTSFVGIDGSGGRQMWTQLAASAVPVLGALIVWSMAERLAVRASEGLLLSDEEIERVLSEDDAELDQLVDDESDDLAGEEPRADGHISAEAWLLGALTVLGALLVVNGLAALVSGVGAFVTANSVFPCADVQLFGGRPIDCDFWSPVRVQTAVRFAGSLVTFGLGSWLFVRPEAVVALVHRLRARGAPEAGTTD